MRKVDDLYGAAYDGDAHGLAVAAILPYVRRGDSLQELEQFHGGAAGPCFRYEWKHGYFTVTAIGMGSPAETQCHHRFPIKRLYDEALHAERPQQGSLWADSGKEWA